jgi:hypothetical protein
VVKGNDGGTVIDMLGWTEAEVARRTSALEDQLERLEAKMVRIIGLLDEDDAS